MEVTEGTLRIDLGTVFADDEHGVAQVVLSASRGDHSVRADAAQVFYLRDGKVTEFWSVAADPNAFDEIIG
jgi:hypothetical protein